MKKVWISLVILGLIWNFLLTYKLLHDEKIVGEFILEGGNAVESVAVALNIIHKKQEGIEKVVYACLSQPNSSNGTTTLRSKSLPIDLSFIRGD